MYEVVIYHEISYNISRNQNSYSYNNTIMMNGDIYTDGEVLHHFRITMLKFIPLSSLISHNIVNKR